MNFYQKALSGNHRMLRRTDARGNADIIYVMRPISMLHGQLAVIDITK